MSNLKIYRNLLSVLILIILTLLSIDVYAQKDVIGKYVGKESNRTIILKKDGGFYLLNEGRGIMFYHIDTLSFGSWKICNNFIILNSSESIKSRKLKVNVQESYNPNSDSLLVEIFNPYEDFSRKYEKGHRIFKYVFYIDSYEGRFGPEVCMKSNKISLPKSSYDKIVNMVITIIPNSYLYPYRLAFNYLETDTYTFSDRNSNHIKVTIPNFTFEYIGYERFREECVRLIRNELILRGEIFKKEDDH